MTEPVVGPQAPCAERIPDDFEWFVRERAAGARKLVGCILGDPSRATALLPAAFADAWLERDPLRPDPARALRRILARRALAELAGRCAGRECTWEALEPRFEDGAHARPVAPWSEGHVAWIRARGSVRVLIERLPAPDRNVLLLRDVVGFESEEAAEILGLEAPVVDARLHRARLALRALVEAVVQSRRATRETRLQ